MTIHPHPYTEVAMGGLHEAMCRLGLQESARRLIRKQALSEAGLTTEDALVMTLYLRGLFLSLNTLVRNTPNHLQKDNHKFELYCSARWLAEVLAQVWATAHADLMSLQPSLPKTGGSK